MVDGFELAFRVGTALFVIAAPTLLFLGLWRGLELLRDDEIIARARDEGYVGSSPTPDAVVGSFVPDAAAEATVSCEACGTSNVAETTYCQQCLGKLPDE
jgi:hypothetical protein